MIRRILVATTNPGKLAEIRRLLEGVPVEVLSLDEMDQVPEPEETGHTFEENARLKALHYAEATGLPTLAEDSGLEIDALDGAPGVQSARFPGVTYPDKFERIFRMLDDRGAGESSARFVCALALVVNGRVLFETRGVVEGRLTRTPRGSGGFGYDPIFFYPPFGKTLAEVGPDDKAAVSHRGRAFRALRTWLLQGVETSSAPSAG